MATQRKIDAVGELSNKAQKAKMYILADYQGIKHKQLEDLRKNLKKVEAEFVVVKNTLLKRALSAHKKTIDEKGLNSSTAAVFGFADEVAPVKALVDFFKAIGVSGKIKSAVLSDKIISADDVEKLSKLPSRLVLTAQLVGQLQAPLYGLHNALSWNARKLVWTLDAVKAKKTV